MTKNHQVEPGLRKLLTAYEHGELVLDLWGRRDEDGIEVCDVTLTGDSRSLGELFCRDTLAYIGMRAESVLFAMEEVARIDAKAELAAWYRFMNKL